MDLVKEANCICGRPFCNDTRNFVNENCDKYLAENNIGVINSIKPIISVSERVVNIDEVISKSIVEK